MQFIKTMTMAEQASCENVKGLFSSRSRIEMGGQGANFLVMTLCLGPRGAKGLVLVHIFICER